MDINTLLQAVSTVGFPIVMCGAMFYYMIKQTNSHKEEVEKIVTALNNNTLAINRLQSKIGVDENEFDTK